MKRGLFKKVLSALLAISMVLSNIPAFRLPVFANTESAYYTKYSEDEQVAEFHFGTDVTSDTLYASGLGYGFSDITYPNTADGWVGGVYYPRVSSWSESISYVGAVSGSAIEEGPVVVTGSAIGSLEISSKVWKETESSGYGVYTYENTSVFSVDNPIYKNGRTKSGGYPLKTALFLAINENQSKPYLIDKLQDYIYIFNTGNLSTDDEYGVYVKEMRDHFYVQNREFSKISASNSASFRRKKLTSIFLYSIESYINNGKYISSIDMDERLQKKVGKQLAVLYNDNK